MMQSPALEQNPFLHDLGVRLNEIGDGRATLELVLEARHMNSWQVSHGGITMTLLDVAMAMAGRSLQADLAGLVTVEMKTTFLQPAGIVGGVLKASGHAYHQTPTMCFCEGELWNGDKLVAKATGTFKYLHRLKSGGTAKNLCAVDE